MMRSIPSRFTQSNRPSFIDYTQRKWRELPVCWFGDSRKYLLLKHPMQIFPNSYWVASLSVATVSSTLRWLFSLVRSPFTPHDSMHLPSRQPFWTRMIGSKWLLCILRFRQLQIYRFKRGSKKGSVRQRGGCNSAKWKSRNSLFFRLRWKRIVDVVYLCDSLSCINGVVLSMVLMK